MKAPFKLVTDTVSTELVECTRALYEQALAGELVGIGFVGMIRRRGFIASTAGECHLNPTFTRGMVAHLDDVLSEMVRDGPAH